MNLLFRWSILLPPLIFFLRIACLLVLLQLLCPRSSSFFYSSSSSHPSSSPYLCPTPTPLPPSTPFPPLSSQSSSLLSSYSFALLLTWYFMQSPMNHFWMSSVSFTYLKVRHWSTNYCPLIFSTDNSPRRYRSSSYGSHIGFSKNATSTPKDDNHNQLAKLKQRRRSATMLDQPENGNACETFFTIGIWHLKRFS